jgi:hypothetical protein
VASERVDQCVAFVGVVSRVVVITRSTSASAIVRGRPGRGSSVNPSRRWATNRLRHLRTVSSVMPSSPAIAALVRPSAAANTIRHRIASPLAVFLRLAHASNCDRSASDNTTTAATRPGITEAYKYRRINNSGH